MKGYTLATVLVAVLFLLSKAIDLADQSPEIRRVARESSEDLMWVMKL